MAVRESGEAQPGSRRKAVAQELFDLLRRFNSRTVEEGGDLIEDITRILRACLETTGGPAILVVEDRQWIDRATCRVIADIGTKGLPNGLMIVDTDRADEDPLTPLPTENIPIVAMEEAAARAMVDGLDRNGVVSPARRMDLVGRAGGNPLFLEELTKFCIDRSQQDAGFEVDAFLNENMILSDLLNARLDALGADKNVIKRASVIGDLFAEDEVSVLLEQYTGLLEVLDNLSAQGVLMRLTRQDDRSEERYRFWHVLIREVAYASLLRRDRRRFHLRHADWIVGQEGWRYRWRPEEVARHYAAGGNPDKAALLWIEAAELAELVGAHDEAIGSGRAALGALEKAGMEEARRSESKLWAYRIMAPAIIASKGRLDVETMAFFEEAVPLCLQTPESPDSYSVLWCWWRIGQTLPVMNERAERLLQRAQATGLPELEMQSHHCLWAVNFLQGRHRDVNDHIACGMALYDESRDTKGIARFGGHDARVCGEGAQALSYWMSGKPDSAERHLTACLEQANGLHHKGSWLHALDAAAMYSLMRADTVRCQAVIAQWRELNQEKSTEEYEAKIALFSAWCDCLGAPTPAAVEQLSDAVRRLRQIGVNEDLPVYLAVRAECLMKAGNHAEARASIDEALQLANDSGVTFWNPEIHRLDAKLAILEGADDASVLTRVQTGIDTARRQGATMLEIRLMLTKCQSLRRMGQEEDAAESLDRLADSLKDRDLEIDLNALGKEIGIHDG